MLDNEQIDYINSLKKTHPDVDKETIREALLGSEWTEIEIMEAISLYNNTSPEKESEEDIEKKPDSKPDSKSSRKLDEDEPVVTVRKSSSKLVSIITALLIILLFIVLIVIGSMVFFQVSLSEVFVFVTVDLANNIAEKMQN